MSLKTNFKVPSLDLIEEDDNFSTPLLDNGTSIRTNKKNSLDCKRSPSKIPSMSNLGFVERSSINRRASALNLASNKETLKYFPHSEMESKAIEVLRKNPKNRSATDIQLLLKAVQNLSFFEPFNKEIQDQFVTFMYYKELKSSSFVFKEGTIGKTLFVIIRGEVGIIKTGDDGIDRELKVLTNGQGFGEIALLEDKLRSASVICKTDCVFACLDKQYFNLILSSYYSLISEDISDCLLHEHFEFLKSLSFLPNLPQENLLQIYSSSFLVSKKRDQVIYSKGDDADKFYIVKDGVLEVRDIVEIDNSEEANLKAEVSITNKQKSFVSYLLTSKSCFGEGELLSGTPRASTIVCQSSSCSLYEFSKSSFFRLLRSHPGIKKSLQEYSNSKGSFVSERKNTILFPKVKQNVKNFEKAKVIEAKRRYELINYSNSLEEGKIKPGPRSELKAAQMKLFEKEAECLNRAVYDKMFYNFISKTLPLKPKEAVPVSPTRKRRFKKSQTNVIPLDPSADCRNDDKVIETKVPIRRARFMTQQKEISMKITSLSISPDSIHLPPLIKTGSRSNSKKILKSMSVNMSSTNFTDCQSPTLEIFNGKDCISIDSPEKRKKSSLKPLVKGIFKGLRNDFRGNLRAKSDVQINTDDIQIKKTRETKHKWSLQPNNELEENLKYFRRSQFKPKTETSANTIFHFNEIEEVDDGSPRNNQVSLFSLYSEIQ